MLDQVAFGINSVVGRLCATIDIRLEWRPRKAVCGDRLLSLEKVGDGARLTGRSRGVEVET